MTEIAKLPNADAIAEEAARCWARVAREAVDTRGEFSIALSGGETPRRLYEAMASEPWLDQTPWAETHVFWGDERRVPASHPDSNYRMAWETLLQYVPVPPEQIHRMRGEDLVNSAVRHYVDVLQRHFKLGRREWPRFDLILLGMGEDGHIASIYPGTRAFSDRSSLVVAFEVPQLGVERMTLTLPVINNARHILFLVAGEAKAETLQAVLEGPSMPSTYPAQAVQPEDGTLMWLIDEAAASRLGN